MCDRNLRGEVDREEVLCALGLVARADKSQKLALAFACADGEGAGQLARPELFRFVVAFLNLLVAVSSPAQRRPVSELHSVVAQSARAATVAVYDAAGGHSRIGFERFLRVVRSRPRCMPWLRVLDLLDEWEAEDVVLRGGDGGGRRSNGNGNGNGNGVWRASPPSLSDSLSSSAAAAAAAGNGDEDEDAPSSASSALNVSLPYSSELALSRLRTLRELGFGHLTVPQMVRAFRVEARAGRLDAEGFRRALRALAENRLRLDDEQLDAVTGDMACLFHVFDRHGHGVVNLNEFVSGLFMLTEGTSEHKLRVAFSLFDADDDGKISRDELFSYVRCFLEVVTVLSATSEAGRSPRGKHRLPPDVEEETARAAREAVDAIMRTADLNHDESLSWTEFRSACQGDDSLAPWLNLLDLL